MAQGVSEAAGDAACALLEAQPPDAAALSGLRALDLRGASWSVVPETLSQCNGLKKVDFGGLRLTSFPDSIAKLPNLEVIFASGMLLTEVPPVLATCAKARMIGLKDNKITALDGSRLPSDLVWLIAAGNPIRELPDIQRLQHVRKLMLSHNRLTCEALAPVAGIAGLEMLRVAANCLETFPPELLRHPRLAWVAVGGNPFAESALEQRLSKASEVVDFAEVTTGERLGSGAGATVYKADWRERSVAVKIWEAEQFSDGTARGEWAVNRVAASPGHPALVGVLGAFECPRPGMILELLPGATAASSPPSFATVTRDELPGQGGRGPVFTATAAVDVAEAVASATAYLHERGVVHGDIYLHNTLVICAPGAGGGRQGAAADAAVDVKDVRLSDFGAAAAVPESLVGEGLKRLEARSFGWLLQDLIDIVESRKAVSANEHTGEVLALLRAVRARCDQQEVDKLPSFADLAASLVQGRGKRRRVAEDGKTVLGAL